MKKALFSLGLLTMTASAVKAQSITTDASWCQAIEQILADKGVDATANCDRDGNTKIIHLTVGNQTKRYVVPVNTRKTDYSSNILVAIDRMDYGPQWGHNNRRLTPRDWHYTGGLSSQRPDEVWEDARDLSYVEEALRTAVARCNRASELMPEYIEQNLNEGNTVLTLRCRVLDLQRGEQYEKESGNAPADKGGRLQRPRVSKRMAYGCVAVQLIDNMTGEVVLNKEFAKYDYVYASSTTDPMDNVVNSISSDITRQLNNRYPSVAPRPAISGRILKAEEVNAKKEKAETVYIDCGTAQELTTSDEFTVYRVVLVNGNSGSTPIGKIKVKEIQGDNLSLCKVSKGDKEIYAALEAGDKLIIK